MSTIAGAGDHHAVRIEIRLGLDPVEQGPDISIRILSQWSVVQGDECLPVTGGAADVREEQRDTELVQVIVLRAEKVGLKLVFGTAMDVNDDRPLPGEAGRRAVEEPRDHSAV